MRRRIASNEWTGAELNGWPYGILQKNATSWKPDDRWKRVGRAWRGVRSRRCLGEDERATREARRSVSPASPGLAMRAKLGRLMTFVTRSSSLKDCYNRTTRPQVSGNCKESLRAGQPVCTNFTGLELASPVCNIRLVRREGSLNMPSTNSRRPGRSNPRAYKSLQTQKAKASSGYVKRLALGSPLGLTTLQTASTQRCDPTRAQTALPCLSCVLCHIC